MPKLLDVVIGLTVVMLVVSLAVTLLTQFLTSLANTNGRMLKAGLARLIAQIDSRLAGASGVPKAGDLADELAEAILTHPMIGERFLGKQRLGSVVHRSELTRLLIEFAIAPPDGTVVAAQLLKPATQTVLKQVLSDHGIPDPSATLKEIRIAELALEQSQPELANGLRHDIAILQKADTQFVAKINAWFDQTIDRVSSVFTAHTRVITFACAVVVAVTLQLDTIAIMNGLWTSDDLRKEIVDEGISLAKKHTLQPGAVADSQSPSSTSTQTTASTSSQLMSEAQMDQRTQDQAGRYLNVLSQYGVVAFPAFNSRQWLNHWSLTECPGIILSALLLSMGAPFWYSTLQTLIRMRSQIAQSDDEQRNYRQTTSKNAAAAISQAHTLS
jgi:hypothetical protein